MSSTTVQLPTRTEAVSDWAEKTLKLIASDIQWLEENDWTISEVVLTKALWNKLTDYIDESTNPYSLYFPESIGSQLYSDLYNVVQPIIDSSVALHYRFEIISTGTTSIRTVEG